LVATLRSELFGVSDQALYSYKKAGGRFSYNSNVPEHLDPDQASLFRNAFSRLRRYWLWISQLPPVPAFGRIVADLGLMARAAARPGGDVSAGSLAKALEILRASQADVWTAAQLVEYLQKLVAEEERHDGISARSHDEPSVRVMNLHKVKGLESSIVFLADPYGDAEHEVTLYINRSGGEVLGYLAIYGEPRGYSKELLAVPAGWDELTALERRFGDAEALRLRYVAATRAGGAMIITDTERGSRTNPWRYFASQLSGAPELPDPGPQAPPDRAEVAISEDDVESARAGIAMRREKVLTPAYATVAAKAYALSLPKGSLEVTQVAPQGSVDGLSFDAGEQGLDWGAVIHLLLQHAMRDSHVDLEGLARTALIQHELDPALSEPAINTVKSIMSSDLWQRALCSPQRLIEVPFEVLKEGESVSMPTLVRGVIDLIFKEPDGWVLVDVKTDRLPDGKVDSLVERYAPQVQLYASAWQNCVGDVVKETVLYFTQAGIAVVLP